MCIRDRLYLNSARLFERNNSILYYDCTNFYFEIEDEDDFLKYGKSKENRPNPIVQYGLFMDANGLPIADITFEGNKNEQFSLREMCIRDSSMMGFSIFTNQPTTINSNHNWQIHSCDIMVDLIICAL